MEPFLPESVGKRLSKKNLQFFSHSHIAHFFYSNLIIYISDKRNGNP
jgi:hypothetical protein